MRQDTTDLLQQSGERSVGKTGRSLPTGADVLGSIPPPQGVQARAVSSRLHRNINRNYVKSINAKRIGKPLQLITVRPPHGIDPPGSSSTLLCHRFGTLTFVLGTSHISDCFLSL